MNLCLFHPCGLLGNVAAIIFCILLLSSNSEAYRFNTGNSDLQIRWDNTVKYSVATRLQKQSDELIGSINQDDGDRAFSRGLISNRFDLLSEMDVIYKQVGMRISGAAWYDSVYHDTNDNTSPSTSNVFSTRYNEFTDDTKSLHGGDAELLDAFVFGRKGFGETAVSIRAGQFAMQWGESLFFGNNGIAGAMAPIDVVKALSVPNTQFKELIRPVPQISAQIQFGTALTAGLYYQLKWDNTRLPAVDSYFGNMDIVGEGSERLIVGAPIIPTGGPAAFFHASDMEADDSGQGGIQLRFPIGAYDFGLYALRYHDKVPQIYLENDTAVPDFETGRIGNYRLVYPENIDVYGASSTVTFGITNLAAEVSYRNNTPLVSDAQNVTGRRADNDDSPAYAVGKSLHAQISTLTSFGPSFIANEATLLGEIAWNKRLAITDNSEALDPHTTKDAWGLRVLYEPAYRQVWPGVDITVPVGGSYFPRGASSVVGSFGPNEGGDISIGITASYLDVWRFRINYTHYYGSSDTLLDENNYFTFKQTYSDRDFIAFSVYRTF